MAEYRLRELKIEVTRDCPLHCLHCSSNGLPHAPEQLEPLWVCDTIKEFAKLGGKELSLSGGEPLCYDGLSAVLAAANGAGVNVSIYTTGLVHDGSAVKSAPERVVNLLAESGARVVFSIHGAARETHERVTGVTGSFDDTLATIRSTIHAGVPVEIHVVPTMINFDELGDIVGLASTLGIQRISWLRFVPQGRGAANKSILTLDRQQLTGLSARRTQLQRQFPGVTIRMGSPFNILCTGTASSCQAGISMLTVGPDGRTSPCDALKQFDFVARFDNVLTCSLAQVWHRSSVLNEVRILQESKAKSFCASCALYSSCESGCLAQKAIAAGTLTEGKDPDCPLGNAEVVRDENKAVTV